MAMEDEKLRTLINFFVFVSKPLEYKLNKHIKLESKDIEEGVFGLETFFKVWPIFFTWKSNWC